MARVFCSTVRPAFLFSERGAERDFLINNVGVELLPSASLSLSAPLSLSDSCQQISVIVCFSDSVLCPLSK